MDLNNILSIYINIIVESIFLALFFLSLKSTEYLL